MMKELPVVQKGALVCCCLLYTLFIFCYPIASYGSLERRSLFALLLFCDLVVGLFTWWQLHYVGLRVHKVQFISMVFIIVALCMPVVLPAICNPDNETLIAAFCAMIGAYVFNFYLGGGLRDFFWFIHIIALAQIVFGYVQLITDLRSDKLEVVVSGFWDSTDEFIGYLLVTYPIFLSSLCIERTFRFKNRQQLVEHSAKLLIILISVSLLIGVLLYMIATKTQVLLFLLQLVFFIHLFLVRRIMKLSRKVIRKEAKISRFVFGGLLTIAGALIIHSGGPKVENEIVMQGIIEKPYFGYGIGTFPIHYPDWEAAFCNENGEVASVNKRHPQLIGNEYVMIIAEIGTVGMFMLMFGLILVLQQVKNYWRIEFVVMMKTTLISGLIAASQTHLFHMPATLMIFFSIIFMFVYDGRQTNSLDLKAAFQKIFTRFYF
ncbi:hypothetical protein [Chitinophaga rhizophila]|uniref:O-antigen ligase n=1 Tax=Chitinophaga rhizophila TaxID=2866212 RepID=A0ABS7GKK1_9BACT|nr:hypothetical protein [Chitinophaga rhizophila]MBW8687269.1 hypothetical protein [Chitinophaga rhizophila]